MHCHHQAANIAADPPEADPTIPVASRRVAAAISTPPAAEVA